MRLPEPSVRAGRIGIVSPEFIPMADAARDPSGYESWSSLCLQHLDRLLAKAGALPRPTGE